MSVAIAWQPFWGIFISIKRGDSFNFLALILQPNITSIKRMLENVKTRNVFCLFVVKIRFGVIEDWPLHFPLKTISVSVTNFILHGVFFEQKKRNLINFLNWCKYFKNLFFVQWSFTSVPKMRPKVKKKKIWRCCCCETAPDRSSEENSYSWIPYERNFVSSLHIFST